jgi:hypothetical protein
MDFTTSTDTAPLLTQELVKYVDKKRSFKSKMTQAAKTAATGVVATIQYGPAIVVTGAATAAAVLLSPPTLGATLLIAAPAAAGVTTIASRICYITAERYETLGNKRKDRKFDKRIALACKALACKKISPEEFAIVRDALYEKFNCWPIIVLKRHDQPQTCECAYGRIDPLHCVDNGTGPACMLCGSC